MCEKMGRGGEGGVFVVIDVRVVLGGAIGLLARFVLEDDDLVNAEDG